MLYRSWKFSLLLGKHPAEPITYAEIGLRSILKVDFAFQRAAETDSPSMPSDMACPVPTAELHVTGEFSYAPA